MSHPQRRPLSTARIRLLHETPDRCEVEVDGKRYDYAPLFAEWFQPLTTYAPLEVVKLREFLLCGEDEDTRHDWDEATNQPCYSIGWIEGGPRVRAVGPGAAMAALRRFYPFRDY